MALDKGPL